MRAWHPASVEVNLEAVPPDQVLDGQPRAGFHELDQSGGASFGVWELSSGQMTDVEVAEYSIVLSGSGELVINDGPPVTLRAGVAFRLNAGDRTVWRVNEPLRKVYFLPPPIEEQLS